MMIYLTDTDWNGLVDSPEPESWHSFSFLQEVDVGSMVGGLGRSRCHDEGWSLNHVVTQGVVQ